MSVPPITSTDQSVQNPPEGKKAEDPAEKQDKGVQTEENKETGYTDAHFYREFWNSEEGRQLLRDCRAEWSKTNFDTSDT